MVVALVATLGLVVQSVISATQSPAFAAAGVPAAPVLLFNETFENGTGADPVDVDAYTGTGGMTYTGDPYFVDQANCNGVLVQYANTNFPLTGVCTQPNIADSRSNIRRFADVLGQFNAGVVGGTDASPANGSTAATQANHAVAEWTTRNAAAAGADIELQSTVLNLPATSSRYVTMSLDVVEASCTYLAGANNSRLDFYLVNGATETKINVNPIRACTDSSTRSYTSPFPPGVTSWGNGGNAVRAGRYFSDKAVLLSPAALAALQIRVRNQTLTGDGNDHAFDNLRLLDATPALDKSFSPTSAPVGTPSTLTLTVTNTSELGGKDDFAFTDTLPSGLTVANPAGATTTCGNGTVTAVAGAQLVALSGGDLASGETSCTVVVQVTSNAAATYTNGPSNVSTSGLNPPSAASVTFFNTDFGDAPASYGTATASHSLSSTLAAPTTPTLGLGSSRDMEAAAAVSAGGTGDDTTGSDDEDAVSGTPTLITNGPMSLAVPLRNTTGAAATLAGWVDFNADGAFQATELVTTSVPAGATTATLVWPTKPTASAGASFLRLRLFPGSVVTPSPTTPAVGGEIEDHPVALSRSGIVVDKTANVTAGVSPVAVTYSYAVTGQLEPLRNVTLTDDKCSVPATRTGDVNGNNVLELGETWVFTCAATLTSTTTNTATATGIGTLSGATVTNTDTWTVTVTAPSLNLSKTGGSVSGPNAAGDFTATYTVRVANTGTAAGTYGPIAETPAFAPNLAVTGASWTGQATGSATGTGPFAIGAAGTTIAVGATHTYNLTVTFHYSNATQASACAGTGTGLYNSVALAAGQEQGATTDNAACIAPPVPPTPAIALTKSISSTVPSPLTGAGQTVNYRFAVTNPGVVQLTSPKVNDSRCTPTYSSGDTNADGILQNGETWIFTCAYATTQADVDAGAVNNTATAQGTPPYLSTPVTSPPSSTSVTIAEVPVIDLTKTATAVTDVDGNGPDAGDRITFGFTVRNAGNATLTSITVTDPMLGTVTCPQTTLAPGASMTCTSVVYTLTQADVDTGAVNNTATALGTTVRGTQVNDPSSTSTTVAKSPALTLTKAVAGVTDVNGNGVTDPGDRIRYTFTVTNTGNTSLSSVTITDDKLGVTNLACAAGPMAPGATATCTPTQTYTVTAADATAGTVVNKATAGATSVGGAAVTSNQATATQPVATPASLNVSKTAATPSTVDPTTGRFTVTYTVRVTNSGQTPTTYGVLTDTPAFAANLVVDGTTWSGPVSGSSSSGGPYALAPAGTAIAGTTTQTYAVTVTAHYTSSAAAAACGGTGTGLFNSVALASGQEQGTTTDNSACVTPPAAPITGLTLTKSVASYQDVNGNGLTDAGDRLTYTFVARNTGSLDLTSTSVSDPKLAAAGITIVCADTILSPGESTTCSPSGPYTITAADVTAGSVVNTATATGTPPNGLPSPTATSSTSTPTQRASLTLDKQAGSIVDADGNGPDAGDTVTYAFVVENTGNTALSNVVVNDALLGLTNFACGTGALAPGATRTCTSPPHVITQADVDTGRVANSATAVGTPPNGATPVSATDTATVTIAPRNELKLTKAASGINDLDGNGADAGDTITFTFSVLNTGSTTLTNVRFDDARLGLTNAACVPSLAPGATAACSTTVVYTLTQADVNAGGVNNSATATATPPSGTPPTSTSTTSTSIANVASITLTKAAGAVSDADGNGPDAGDTVTYTFTVANTSNVPLTSVSIDDGKLGLVDLVCSTATLNPGQSVTCASPAYVLTQADVDAGRVDNTATVSGTSPSNVVVQASASATRTFTPVNSIALVKTASAVNDVDGNGPDAGDTIAYSFTVTNTGRQSLTQVLVSDPLLRISNLLCTAGPLAPGASATCAAPTPYVLTQADVDARKVDNTASVTGTPPGGAPVTNADTETAGFAPLSRLALVKAAGTVTDADSSTTQNAGDTIVYTFTVTNTGATSLDPIAVTDPMLGAGTVTCPSGRLAPGASVTCTSTAYALTQTDIDAGRVDNTATATGGVPGGGTVSATDQETKPVAPTNAVELTKTAGTVTDVDGNLRPSPGDTITYSFTVRNTGGSTLTHLVLTDGLLGLSNFLCSEGPLAPGASLTCTSPVTYPLTQSDINAGKVDNTATVTGTAKAGANPSDSDAATAPVTRVAAIELTKTASVPTTAGGQLPGSTDAGDTITYTFTVTNTSNVTLTDVGIDDGKLGLSGYTCDDDSLDPGQIVTCTRTYTITQADIDLRAVNNTATVEGTDPQDKVVTDEATANRALAPVSSLVLDKQAGTPTVANGANASATDAGDTVTYTFVVTNTGVTSLTTVRISDAKLGLTDSFCATGPVAPGASVQCTATATLTQADIDAGRIDNQAQAGAASPNGPVTATDTATVAVTPVNAISLVKSGSSVVDADGNGPDAGDRISYTFAVTNQGTTTLAPVTITDSKLGLTDLPCVTTLAPGDTATCAAPSDYLLTQADVDHGAVDNTATATGDAPAGPDPTAVDSETVQVANLASLTLAKTAGAVSDVDAGGQDAGDTVVYTFVVTNVSNLTLTNVVVTDPMLAGAGVGLSCPATTLAPRASMTCSSAPYALTQADIDRGRVDNTATVRGTTPQNGSVQATDPADVVLTPVSRISLDKTAGAPTDPDANGPDVGDAVTYTFTVTNTGATTVSNVAIDDGLLGLTGLVCGTAPLAPGESTECTATYSLTQQDVDRGRVDNTATAQATSPNGTVSDSDPAQVVFTPRSSIILTKTAGSITDVDQDRRTSPGDTIEYFFTVQNTGSTTLTDVTIDDPKLALSGLVCTAGPLAPGATATCEATKVYALTQADVDAGSVDNTATATADAPLGADPTDTDDETRLVDRVTGIDIVKSAGTPTTSAGRLPTVTDAGDTVVYTFRVENTSNVTLTDVTVSDAMLAAATVAVTCPTATLAPGAVMTCTSAGYPLTQTDIDAARVDNLASAAASSPAGPVSASDVEDLVLTPASSITLDKTAGTPTDVDDNGFDAGDTIVYSFAVTNTGATTLDSVTIADPRIGQPGMPCGSGPLAPGAVRGCSAPAYVLTQADVDAGGFTNRATASATPPGSTPPVTAVDSVTVTVGSSPALTVQKTAGTPTVAAGRLATATDAGDTVVYTITVANTGNVTLDPVLLTDQRLGLSGVPCDGTTALAPGSAATCTFTYELTQADIDVADADNLVVASGTPPTGPAITPQDTVPVPLTPAPALSLVKNASAINDLDGNGADAGDTIDYSFTVTNDGSTTLSPVTITDPRLGLTDLECVATLAPGATATCPAPAAYVLTQADIDAGTATNLATATGDSPVGTDPSDQSSTTTQLTNVGSVVLTKTAGTPTVSAGTLPTVTDAGDTVRYAFTVTNTSNVTLTSVEVTDALVGTVTCPASTLASHASMDCTAAPYRLTQADIDAGRVDNHATVAALAPGDKPVNDADDAAVTITPQGGLRLDKSGAAPTTSAGRLATTTDAGDSVTYTFTVTNTGSQTLSPVTIADARIGVTALTCVTALAPGATAECTATYVLTQGDVDAGRVDNTATASGMPPGASVSPVTDTDDDSVVIAPSPSIRIDKTAGTPTVAAGRLGTVTDAGDTVDYTLVVTNTGSVSLSSVTVTDEKLGLSTAVCAGVTSLAPGASASCSFTYTLGQPDIDAAGVDNTASASGNPPTGAPVTHSDSVHVAIVARNALSLVKSASQVVDVDGNGPDVGDTVDYTFTVTNDGSGVLAPVTITDAKLGLVDYVCTTSLAPGASTTCPAPAAYLLTQQDVDNGEVLNTATATGGAGTGTDPTATDDATVDVRNLASLVLDKVAGAPTVAAGRLATVTDAGDTVRYTFTVTNVSNVTLTDVAVSDPLLGAVTCTDTTLAPHTSTTCTAAPYVLTQVDVDAGRVDNTATATATDPDRATVSGGDTAVVLVPAASSLSLDKQAGAVTDTDVPVNGAGDLGDTITYTFLVTNTGNTTLTIVSISDPALNLAALQCVATLAPGEATTCTAVHALTQDEVDDGGIINTATATAVPPNPSDPPATGTDTAVTTVASDPSVTIEKTAGRPTVAKGRLDTVTDAGDTVVYTLLVTNTGNVTLDPVRVTDAKLGLDSVVCDGGSSLAPGASATCAFSYPLLQSDIDAGRVDNLASVSGTPPTGAPVSYTDLARVDLTPTNALSLTKTASAVHDLDRNGPDLGDTVDYSFSVTNGGSTTLAPVTITDSRLGGPAFTCVASLAPGRTATCDGPAPYLLTQADVDSGAVVNVATATGDAPVGTDPTDTSTATVDVDNLATIALLKTAGAPSVGAGALTTVTDAGDTVTYTFRVTNTSNVTLEALEVTDPKVGRVTCPQDSLAPRASMTCTAARYVLTQADVDAGRVDNTASVSATNPEGDPVGATDSEVVTITPRNAVSLAKSGAAPTVSGGALPTVVDAGDTVTYTFTVTNDGSQTLSPLSLDDAKLGLVGLTCARSLAPGESADCTAVHPLTQADVDAGRVDNTAVVTGTPPGGAAPVRGDDSATVSFTPAASIDLTKHSSAIVDVDGNGADSGDTMTFDFLVENTGAQTLAPVTIDDPMLGLVDVPCVASLAPGDSATCEAPVHVLTQGDIDAGQVVNTATATGDARTGTDPTDESTTRTPLTNLATMTIDKSAGAVVDVDHNGQDAGDTVTYSFVVANTSNLTLTGVQVTDPKLGTVSCPSTTLAAHTSMTCTAAAYVLTQADIDRGRVDNTATLVATGPQGSLPSVTDTAAVTLTPVSAIGLVKSASAVADLDDNGTDVGDSVTYSFTVTNKGTTTLEPVTVTDAKLALAGMPCGSGPLAPGASRTCAAPAYALTQADLDAGHVENAATVTGRGPGGSSVTADGSVSFQTAGPSAITLRKTATLNDRDGNGAADAGETIDYGLTVTNSGSVTLTSIRITDAMLGIDDALCARGPVAPGESVACTELVTSHRVTASEVAAGQVRNVATATGEGPGGQVVRDADAVTTPADPPAGPPGLEFRDDPSPLPDGLAFTGSNAFTMLGAALALLVLGFLLLLGRRRADGHPAAAAGRHRG